MAGINEFIRENTSWFNKLIRNYPKIKNTKEFKKGHSTHSENITFKVNKLNLVIITLINLILFLSTLLLSEKCIYHFEVKHIIGLAISVFLFLIIFRKLITHLKNIFQIKLDEKYLEINEIKYPWSEIKETYLVYEHQNKKTILHLIIEKKKNEFENFNLLNFKLNDDYFCSQIEYFKNEKSVI
jgi:hypothetical protein